MNLMAVSFQLLYNINFKCDCASIVKSKSSMFEYFVVIEKIIYTIVRRTFWRPGCVWNIRKAQNYNRPHIGLRSFLNKVHLVAVVPKLSLKIIWKNVIIFPYCIISKTYLKGFMCGCFRIYFDKYDCNWLFSFRPLLFCPSVYRHIHLHVCVYILNHCLSIACHTFFMLYVLTHFLVFDVF